MKSLFSKLHARVGDLWWYSAMLFLASRSGDAIQAFIGLWLVPRYVGSEELGAVLPLQQLSGFFTVPLAVIAIVFTKYVNTYATRGERGKVKSFIRDVLLVSVTVFIGCILVAFLMIPYFYERLNISAGFLTLLILLSGFVTNLSGLFGNALQGLKQFSMMTVINLIGAPIRLVTLLVFMPVRALSGYFLGQTTPAATGGALAALSLRRELRDVPCDTSWRKDIPEILRYTRSIAAFTFIGVFTGTIFATVVRQRLPAIESAAFYMLTRFSELASYCAASLTIVLFPLVSEAHEKGENASGLLLKTTIASGCSTLLLAVFFHFMGSLIFSHVSAWRVYLPYVHLLPALTLFSGTASLIAAFNAYESACRHFITLWITYALSILSTILLVVFTGYEFFRGILPDKIVDMMASLHLAQLSTITLVFTIWNVFMLIVFAICDRLYYPAVRYPQRKSI